MINTLVFKKPIFLLLGLIPVIINSIKMSKQTKNINNGQKLIDSWYNWINDSIHNGFLISPRGYEIELY